jgi:AraC family transcriptional regulator, transcriptional activator of the genes for pyochelin and ferripyochelin receptors
MNSAPTILFDEFSHYTTHTAEVAGFQMVERKHPDFGKWNERHLDLGHIKIYEHRADLKRKVNVKYDDNALDKFVHHCMCVDGALNANFRDSNLSAKLSPRSFHSLFLPGDEYQLGMDSQFVNVHIAIDRDYYLNLLSDSEKWSAEIKNQILKNAVYYAGEHSLTLTMLQPIHAIFNSAISGALKKVLIEAKVLELIALQLQRSSLLSGGHRKEDGQRDLFIAIQQYLDDTFLQDHSLKNIAKHFGINDFNLKKGFKENIGTTVFEYLLSKRLGYSLQLLQSTNQSISDIGSIVGYKYPNHFSTSFKKMYGINPSELRNDYLN